MFRVSLNLELFKRVGDARIREAGYNARYYGGVERSACPHGEDDSKMREAWIKGWQDADSDCWAVANPA